MKKSSVKQHKAKELDLLPVMSLFSILVTIVISMASFEKLGILELWLPERSQSMAQPEDQDLGLLNLAVVITDNSITVGASNGFQPAVYYQEEVQYRSRSDQNVFRKIYVKGEKVYSSTDHKLMGLNEKETILLNVIAKKDSADPGTYVIAAQDHDGEPLMDTAGNWYKDIPPVGAPYRAVGDETILKMNEATRATCKVDKLNAYYEVARVLEKVHKMYSRLSPLPTDVDDIVILAGEDVIYDKIIQMMDAAKAAGYDRVALSLMGGAT